MSLIICNNFYFSCLFSHKVIYSLKTGKIVFWFLTWSVWYHLLNVGNWMFVCIPPNSYVESLIPNVTIFRNRSCEDVMWLDEVIVQGPCLIGLGLLKEEERIPGFSILPLGTQWEGRQPSAKRTEHCHQEPNPLAPSSQTAQLPEVWGK